MSPKEKMIAVYGKDVADVVELLLQNDADIILCNDSARLQYEYVLDWLRKQCDNLHLFVKWTGIDIVSACEETEEQYSNGDKQEVKLDNNFVPEFNFARHKKVLSKRV